MSLNIIMGSVTLSFIDERGDYCPVRKIANYNGDIPADWRGEDHYIIIPIDCYELRPKFTGMADSITLNGGADLEFINETTNTIVVRTGGMVYTLRFHLVAENGAKEAYSSGIELEKFLDIYLFKPLSWWAWFFCWWVQPAYNEDKEDWCAFEVEGVPEVTDENPWDSDVLDGPDHSGNNPGLFEG